MDRFIRCSEVVAITGISRSSVYARMAEGNFPRPVRVGSHSVRWKQSEIENWVLAIESSPRAGPKASSK